MEGKKIIEDLLRECSKFTIPGHVDTLAYLSSKEADLDITIKNLKLSREINDEETLKFLEKFLPRFSKEVGVEVTTKAIEKIFEPIKIFKYHYYLGYFLLFSFFISLVTFNFLLGVLSLFLFMIIAYFGKKLISLTPKEGIKILRSYCIPLSGVTFIFWIVTLILIWRGIFSYAFLFGGLAILSFGIVQFWSGPKVKKTQEALKELILSKL